MILHAIGSPDLNLKEIVVIQGVFLELAGLLHNSARGEEERSLVIRVDEAESLVLLDGVLLI